MRRSRLDQVRRFAFGVVATSTTLSVLIIVPSPAAAYFRDGGSLTARVFPSDSTNSPIVVGKVVHLDLTQSSGAADHIVKYEWDTTGDGTYDKTTTDPILLWTYEEPGDILLTGRITDSDGNTAVGTYAASVVPAGDTGISINDGAQFTNTPNVTVSLVWPGFSRWVRLSNDGGLKGAKEHDLAESVPWRLQSSGPERLPKTVYARFGNNNETFRESYTDDIILDETDPVLSAVAIASASPRSTFVPGAAVARVRTYHLRIKATDKLSGVAKMQITANRGKPGKLLRYSNRATYLAGGTAIYVRARDRAGNYSKWRRASR